MRKKRALTLILTLLFAAGLVAGLSACATTVRSISFAESVYTVYLEEGETFSPTVTTRPKNRAYTLSAPNDSVLEILEDGVTVRALGADCVATLIATAKDAKNGETAATAETTVYVFQKRDYTPPAVSDSTYEVFFDTGGRGGLPSQFVEPGKLAVYPGPYAVSGYSVGGWYLDEACTVPYDFSSPVLKRLVLYALWLDNDEPEFLYNTVTGGVEITGFRYPLMKFTTVEIPETDAEGRTVVGIAENAFYRAAGSASLHVEAFVIPATVQTISASAFRGLTTLKSVFFDGESAVTAIGAEAFSGCTALETLTLPDSLTTLGKKVFYNCAALNIAALPAGLTKIPEDGFYNTAITYVNLSHVTHVEARAFQNSKLSSINYVNNITTLETDAFSGTAWEKQAVTFGNILTLGDILVKGTAKISSSDAYNVYITVPASIRLIAQSAFPAGTYYNGAITFESETPPIFNSYAVSSKEALALVVPKDALSAYYNASGANRGQFCYRDEITDADYPAIGTGGKITVFVHTPTGTNPIPTLTLFNCTTFAASLDLNAIFTHRYHSDTLHIRKIKHQAFAGNLTNLVTLTLPPQIMSIEPYAFYTCPALLRLTLNGEWGTYTPLTGYLGSKAFHQLPASFSVFVPSSKLTVYRTLWTGLTYNAISGT